VYVTVSVRDAKGKVVSGLGLDDFVLYEDGSRCPISVVASASEPGEERNLALDVGILFDTSETMAKEIRRAQESALRFLRHGGREVVITSYELMCAAVAGQRARRVLLIDHSLKLGEKIRISGGGRCNFTNLHCRPENFLSANPHFARSALARSTCE